MTRGIAPQRLCLCHASLRHASGRGREDRAPCAGARRQLQPTTTRRRTTHEQPPPQPQTHHPAADRPARWRLHTSPQCTRACRRPIAGKGKVPGAGVPAPRGRPLVGPPHRRRVFRLALQPDRALRRARLAARLRDELHRHGRLGRALPHPHHRGVAPCRRGAGRHVLHGVRDREPAHLHRQLRRAHLPGVRHRRDRVVSGLPDPPRPGMRAHDPCRAGERLPSG